MRTTIAPCKIPQQLQVNVHARDSRILIARCAQPSTTALSVESRGNPFAFVAHVKAIPTQFTLSETLARPFVANMSSRAAHAAQGVLRAISDSSKSFGIATAIHTKP